MINVKVLQAFVDWFVKFAHLWLYDVDIIIIQLTHISKQRQGVSELMLEIGFQYLHLGVLRYAALWKDNHWQVLGKGEFEKTTYNLYSKIYCTSKR